MLILSGPPPAENEAVQDVLYIAMAGTHQIWAMYLKDSTWLKGGSVYMSINKHANIYQLTRRYANLKS